jgi:hypothetical protein
MSSRSCEISSPVRLDPLDLCLAGKFADSRFAEDPLNDPRENDLTIVKILNRGYLDRCTRLISELGASRSLATALRAKLEEEKSMYSRLFGELAATKRKPPAWDAETPVPAWQCERW